MKSIGASAFMGCSNLTSIVIRGNVISIGSSAFAGCSNLILWVHPDSYAETYATKNNITYKYLGDHQVTVCSHSYTAQTTKSPSCIITGVRTFTCQKCGDTYTESIPATGHQAVTDKAVSPTCTQAGKTEGSHCSTCGNVLEKPKSIPATGHTYKTKFKKATIKKNGSIMTQCMVCKNVKSLSTVYAPKTITLSKTSYVYNGKTRKPSVTVKDQKGKTLKENTDYNIFYGKGLKNVGSYSVSIQFKGNYSGTVKRTFTIIPKGTSVSKIMSKKKGFSLKWKKQTSQTTGYEIQYSTSSKFTKKTTKLVQVKTKQASSKTVSKLKGKKKYYVRIRTYKTANIRGKSTKICSSWSKTKSVTTKK